jgi:hypothetical protein
VHRTKDGVTRLAGALLLAVAATLTACTSQEDLRQAEVKDLAVLLPGVYANPQQVLVIMNIFAPMMSGNLLYVRETAADDVRRVISERIWSIDVNANNHIVATVYSFGQPDRWRNGVEDPELFRSMMQDDVRQMAGCELIWEKTARGYNASSASPRCPQSWKFDGDQLAFSDRPVDPRPGAPDSYFHFVRQSAPQ